MQSLLQYRRFRRHLEQQIKEQSIEKARNLTDSILKSADHAANPHSVESSFASSITGASTHQLEAKRSEKRLLIVDFERPSDPFNPQTWSKTRKWTYTFLIGATGFIVSGAAAFDTAVTPQAAEDFGVSQEIALLNTTLFMIALGLGSLVSAPFSETVGRNPVYIICITAFALFEVGAALAQNIETQLICRFFAALFGCPPLTTLGGSIADMWEPLDRTYVFPIISVPTFIFPFLAPTVADFIATSSLVSWQWTDWITAILAGAVVLTLVVFVPETYPPVLLSWKAKHLRDITGDQRYRAFHELHRISFGIRLLRSVARPIKFLLTEPIVDLFSLWLVIVYLILFGFLPGFDFIFGQEGIYGFDQRHTGLFFIGINVGFLFVLIPIRPLYQRFRRKLKEAEDAGMNKVEPEERLWFAMMGAPCMTISIFWMGWSSWSSVSYWSPLLATVLFGFGTLGVFISSYQYIIDSFEAYAASALVGMTVTRYCVAGKSTSLPSSPSGSLTAPGPMVIVSVPMYKNLGVHWALTLVGCLSLLMTPVPFIFYKYGAAIRKKSRSATDFAS